jgi:hypothetical protein
MRWSIIVLISLALACSKKEATAPAEPEPAAETEAPPSDEGAEATADPAEELPEELNGDTPAVGAPPVVKVLELGKEPRRALRLNIKPGFEQRLSVDVGYAVDAVIALLRFGSPKYVVSYDLTMRATKVEDDGTVRVAFTIDEASADLIGSPDRVEQLKPVLSTMRKVTGSYVLGARGHVTDIEMKVPSEDAIISPEVADNLRWTLVQMIPAFPEQPVGQGAKWTVHAGIEQGGAQVNQLTTTEIVKLDQSGVELALAVQQTATPQRIRNPSTQQMLKLTTLNGSISGSLRWGFNELSPRAANLDASAIKGLQHRPGQHSRDPVGIIVKADRTIDVVDK